MPLREGSEELLRKRERLINRLVREGYIRSDRVREAMLKVPRHLFVPPHLLRFAYDDTPLPIGRNQTISAPHMVAMMTELLELEEGLKVLEIGTGSGYQAAILAEIVGPSGLVISVEYYPDLAAEAYRRIRALGYDNVLVVAFDGSLGFPPLAPYDRILVTCAAPEFPRHMLRQLKEDGILIVPVGASFFQSLMIYRNGRIEDLGGVAFVPMRGRKGVYPP